jgi:hypothetical protein
MTVAGFSLWLSASKRQQKINAANTKRKLGRTYMPNGIHSVLDPRNSALFKPGTAMQMQD